MQPSVLRGACCSSSHEAVFLVLLKSVKPQSILPVLTGGTARHNFPVFRPTMASTAPHSSTRLAHPPPPTAPAAPHATAEVCPRCGGAPRLMQPNVPGPHHVHVSICGGPGAVYVSPAVVHCGDDVWKLPAPCGCAPAVYSHSTGQDRVFIPPGARVWFECPCCGLLFGSVADFGRHDCASESGVGVGGSTASATSDRAASRT